MVRRVPQTDKQEIKLDTDRIITPDSDNKINEPCYYEQKTVESMLSDIHDFMLIKKSENGTRDSVLVEHRKELNIIHKDINEIGGKVAIATVMGAITLALLAAFLTITTYLVITSFS